ncbi:helix-turn-helix domain-containing protein [Selenomonas sp. AE3005]|uniref:helix-turn-helix domain-containing protein n=1 Tax=Selenomonas sp. AE3005 TaxID=1485543 RepID=UPI0025EE92C5|nr:helix-turn-helix domain-containing protein [Selenomonas sp. AE3005]
MKTAHILRELRLARNMSQNEIAKALGIDRTTYVKYEHGGSIKRNLPKLADFFNVSTDYLLGRDINTNREEPANYIINDKNSTSYNIASMDDISLISDHESSLIKKYRSLKPEHQKAVDIQIGYFHSLDNKS